MTTTNRFGLVAAFALTIGILLPGAAQAADLGDFAGLWTGNYVTNGKVTKDSKLNITVDDRGLSGNWDGYPVTKYTYNGGNVITLILAPAPRGREPALGVDGYIVICDLNPEGSMNITYDAVGADGRTIPQIHGATESIYPFWKKPARRGIDY